MTNTYTHTHTYYNDQSPNVSWAFTISQPLYTTPLSAVDKQHYRDFNKVISLMAKVKLSTDHISKSVRGKRKEVSSRIRMRRERELTREMPLKWNLKAYNSADRKLCSWQKQGLAVMGPNDSIATQLPWTVKCIHKDSSADEDTHN